MTGILQGKVAIVTGGGSGIGRAAATVFAREGARVVVGDVAVEGGEETAKMVKKAGGDAIFVKCDVSKAAEVEAMISKAVETYGRLDCAFNNVGISHMGKLADCTEEEWDRVIDINLKGVWLCMKYEITYMAAHGGGAIVNTSSTAGLVGNPIGPIYATSKHGVIGLTKSGALQYAKSGIRVNAVCPEAVRTGMTLPAWSSDPQRQARAVSKVPMGRPSAPEEIAEAVLWLLSDAASFVTGCAMAVDGGYIAQ